MIKIKKISIHNYKSCIETHCNIDDNLSAFIGVNGSGKSNFLTSLLLFKKAITTRNYDDFFFFFEDENNIETKIAIEIDIDNTIYKLKGTFFLDTDEKNNDIIKYQKLEIRSNKNKYFEIENRISYQVHSFMSRGYDIDQILEAIETRKLFTKSFENFSTSLRYATIKILVFLNKINYYGATQFSDPKKCPTSLDLEHISIMNRTNNHHEKFIHDLYTTFKSNKALFKKFTNVVGPNSLNLIEEIKFYTHSIPKSQLRVKSGGKIEKIEGKKDIVVPSITIDNLKLSPNQLSEGTFKTIALIFYILKDNSSILIIEEPEVCVHHGLLSSIIELLKFESNNKQILISTHADSIIDKLVPENLILVNKESELGTKTTSLVDYLDQENLRYLKIYLREDGNLGEYWKQNNFEL